MPTASKSVEGTGDTILRDIYYSRTLGLQCDRTWSTFLTWTPVAANDTVIASNLSTGHYWGGAGNDTLQAGSQDTTWLVDGTDSGYDLYLQAGGPELVVAQAVNPGTVIGIDGYENGVDSFSGTGDTIIQDIYYSRTLDFSQTELTGIAEVNAGRGNELTIVASNISPASLSGRIRERHPHSGETKMLRGSLTDPITGSINLRTTARPWSLP